MATGRTLKAICQEDNMPTEAAVRQWHLDDHDGFASLYTRARDLQQLALVEEMHDIAEEEPRMMVIETEHNGRTRREERIDPGFEQWRKTRLDQRRWTASKTLPKVYGDRIAVDATIGIDANQLTTSQLLEIAARGRQALTIDAEPADVCMDRAALAAPAE